MNYQSAGGVAKRVIAPFCGDQDRDRMFLV